MVLGGFSWVFVCF